MNRMKALLLKIILINLCLLSIASLSLAQPAVTSVSGRLENGTTLVIGGSGFGSKSPAAPFFWHNFEGESIDNDSAVAADFSGVWSPAACGEWSPRYKNSSSPRWLASPHSGSSIILGMGNRDRYALGDQGCRNAMASVIDSNTHDHWYAMFYHRYSADFQTYPPAMGQSLTAFDFDNYSMTLNRGIDNRETIVVLAGQDYRNIGVNDVLRIDNEKLRVVSVEGANFTVTRGHLGTTAASHTEGTRVYLRGNLYNQKSGLVEGGTNVPFASAQSQIYGLTHKNRFGEYDLTIDGGGGISQCTPCGQEGTSIAGNDATDEWKHIELIVKDSAPGFFKTLVNNVYSQDCTCSDAAQEGATSHDYYGFSFGTYLRGGYPEGVSSGPYHANSNSWTYFDDIYVDTTFSRAMLANDQDYKKATIIEPQIPSAWSSNSITVSVNLGRLSESGAAYLFVFDANNAHNTVGYAIGGGGAGSSSPASPSGLTVK